ncbi:Pre-mrna-splicing factor rbm22 [Thalictrum thalictroides]|uniref:Pre-mrna-splicing factor rbm22 n=1 Tax=Thalictrum thalictroides TaxID=46969 RepID=A0A7J6VEE4_THATH|nr:Pre-mrna-splicing factor rbm22 [Thalictrum thalictroides]
MEIKHEIDCEVVVATIDKEDYKIICESDEPEVIIKFRLNFEYHVVEVVLEEIVGSPIEPRVFIYEKDREISFKKLVDIEQLEKCVWDTISSTSCVFCETNFDEGLHQQVMDKLKHKKFMAYRDVAKIDVIVEMVVRHYNINDITTDTDIRLAQNNGFEEEEEEEVSYNVEFDHDGIEEEIVADIQTESMQEGYQTTKSGASRVSIDALESRILKSEESIEDICTICRDEFFAGEEIKEMPCSHIYHANCILHWLENWHICPLCRFELPKEEEIANDDESEYMEEFEDFEEDDDESEYMEEFEDFECSLDTALAINSNDSIPRSEVNREYFAKEHDRRARAGIDYESSFGKARPNETILKLRRTTAYYKRNRAHVCSFYVRGECTRGAECPYQHEMTVTGELSLQNIKDLYYGNNNPCCVETSE